jgi:NAD+ kinase
MSEFSVFGLIGKPHDARAAAMLNQIAAHLLGKLPDGGRYSLLLADDALPDAPIQGAEAVSASEFGRRCQLAIVVGGDGTLLSAGRRLAPYGVPILGINQGRLGFMVDVKPQAALEALDAVLAGESHTESRLMLQARVLRPDGSAIGPMAAVNDVVLRSLATIRMLEFETWAEGEFIGRHRADGFIVATPTGSTAYALSGGGPVMHPALDAFALVPICPHTLSDRPIVIDASRRVRIALSGDVSGATVTCDGQTVQSLCSGDVIEVSRAPHPLRLVHPRGYAYFDVLREKLNWGRGPVLEA